MKIRIYSDGIKTQVMTDTGELIEGVYRAEWSWEAGERAEIRLWIQNVEVELGGDMSGVLRSKKRV